MIICVCFPQWQFFSDFSVSLWCLVAVIPALGRLTQEDDYEFSASFGVSSECQYSTGYRVRPCLKKLTYLVN